MLLTRLWFVAHLCNGGNFFFGHTACKILDPIQG